MAVKISSQIEHYNTSLNVALGKYIDLSTTGAPDIGAALVDADTMLVGDGGSGTPANTKTATMSRLKTYMEDNITGFITDDADDSMAGKLTIVKTSNQLQLGYDSNNWAKFTVGTNGELELSTNDSDGSDGHFHLISDGRIINQVIDRGLSSGEENFVVSNASHDNVGFGINLESGASTALSLYQQGGDSQDDYFRIEVEEHGATNISTVDAAAAAANLTYNIDGQITMNGSQIKLNPSVSNTFSAPSFIQYAADGSDTSLSIVNTAAAGSTDETVGINFYHLSAGTTAAAKIYATRVEDYSGNAEKSAGFIIETSNANTCSIQMHLSNGDIGNSMALGGTSTLPYKIMTGGAANILLQTNNGTNSGSISIIDGANGNIDIHPNGTGMLDMTNVNFETYAVFDSEVNVSNIAGAVNTGIDWKQSNKIKLTQTNDCALDFAVDPAGACNLVMKVVQGAASSLITSWTTTSSANIYWAGGHTPVLSTGSGDIDIITFYFDGTDYYGAIANNFE